MLFLLTCCQLNNLTHTKIKILRPGYLGPGVLNPEGLLGYNVFSILPRGEAGRKDRAGGALARSQTGEGRALDARGRVLEFPTTHVQEACSTTDVLG